MVTLTVCEFVIVMTAANQSIGADGYVDCLWISLTEAFENGHDHLSIPRVASFAESPSLAMGEVRT